MTTETKTFKEPWLTKVKEAVGNAVSITWDTCHKIYICTSEESHNQQVEYGYEMERVDSEGKLESGKPAVAQLYEWFCNSCGLEFIQAISGNGTECPDFSNVIGQFDYNEEDDDE